MDPGWIIVIIQILAFGFAIFEYRNWKKKKSEEDLHRRLISLRESIILLKFSLLDLHRWTRVNFKASLTQSHFKDKQRVAHDAYRESKKMYREEVFPALIDVKAKLENLENDISEEVKAGMKILIMKSEVYNKFIFYLLTEITSRREPKREFKTGKIDDRGDPGEVDETFEDEIQSLVSDIAADIDQISPITNS